jgi:glycosyltransferase involved in cell wall biosynthesis
MKVSTIIPSYNAARYVASSITSALAQEGVTTEIIVVDDGSTDETWQVLEGFGDRIRKVRQQNSGPARSRNHGAQLASGEWLAFLDADDEWVPDKLARQIALADERTAIVYSDRANVGACERVAGRLSDCVQFFEGDAFEPLLIGNFITTSSVIMRREWFDRLGGFDEGFCGCEDWDLWLRCTAAGGCLRVCQDPLVRYRWHPCSISHKFEHMLNERIQVIERNAALPRGRQVPRRVVRKAIAGAWQCSAWFLAPTHRTRAIGWYLRSAWHWPWDLGVYKGIVKCCLGRV